MTETLDSSTSAAVEPVATEMVAVLDFGSQYSQLITRRVREAGVYSELFHHDTPWAEIEARNVRGIILSGGPASVYEAGAPQLPDWVLESGLPVLGICYGMQLLAQALGGSVEPADGANMVRPGSGSTSTESPLFADLPDSLDVWMSHGDHVAKLPRRLHHDRPERQRALAAIASGQDRRDPVPPRSRPHAAWARSSCATS